MWSFIGMEGYHMICWHWNRFHAHACTFIPCHFQWTRFLPERSVLCNRARKAVNEIIQLSAEPRHTQTTDKCFFHPSLMISLMISTENWHFYTENHTSYRSIISRSPCTRNAHTLADWKAVVVYVHLFRSLSLSLSLSFFLCPCTSSIGQHILLLNDVDVVEVLQSSSVCQRDRLCFCVAYRS